VNVNDITNILKTAPRTGAQKDDPEGARFITISETLAEQMAQELESWTDTAKWKLPILPTNRDRANRIVSIFFSDQHLVHLLPTPQKWEELVNAIENELANPTT
jgi:Fic family protein